MIQRRHLKPLGASFLVLVSACANVLNFEDFRPVPTDDASEEPSGDDATVDAAPAVVQDATVDSEESSPPVSTVDAADTGDAQDAEGGGADACAKCGERYCVDFTSDPNHCGTCNIACTSLNTKCIASQCTCAPPTHPCGGQCVFDSVDTCGAGCTVCRRPPGYSGLGCNDGGCTASCPMPTILCNPDTLQSACVDTTQTSDHCGDCVTACVVPDGGLTSTCVSSACVLDCKTGLKPCPAAKPTTCVDMANDVHNCGACGMTCPAHDGGAAASCIGGICH